VLTRWQGGFASVVAVLAMVGLVIGDLTDAGLRRWWLGHTMTADTVAGLIVLLVTVLVVNQVLTMRQGRDRAQATAAQAGIIMVQAVRSHRAVSAALDGSGDPHFASDEVRTYMIMLLVGAPVLIDTPVSRNFLEQAQRFGAEMMRGLRTITKAPGQKPTPDGRLDDAATALRAASAPLLTILNLEGLDAAHPDEFESQ
jgi:hypothetical protein